MLFVFSVSEDTRVFLGAQMSTSDIKLDIVSDLSALCTSGLITRDIVSLLGLSITALNTSGILLDIV